MRLMSRAALGLAAILFVAPALHAQTSFSVAAGAALPMGSTSDVVKTGYNVTAGLGIKPPLAPLGFRAEAAWNEMDGKGALGTTTRLIAGIANVTLSAPAMPMGYLIGGVGLYNISAPDVPNSASETKAGFNVGVGLNLPLTGFSTFAEARFHLISTPGESLKLVPITFGIKF
jgi:hypothetical protein